MKQKLFLIHLKGLSILDQLKIEEALLRTSNDSYCIINEGTSPAIVMGISGCSEELVDLERAKKDKIPVIRRFSGGGTVFVDEETLFISFILQKEMLSIPLFPSAILAWFENFYRPIFNRGDFALKENDFVFGERRW